MPEWVVALIGIFCTAIGAGFMYLLHQDRRITRLEERNGQLGSLIRQLPKRKTDRVDG